MNIIPLWAQFVIAIIGSGTVGGIAGVIGGIISSSKTAEHGLKELEITRQQLYSQMPNVEVLILK